MSFFVRARDALRAAAVAPAVVGLVACSDRAPTEPNAAASAAFDVWRPTAYDTCSAAVHNRYSVAGPDGKRYPTWHPPVDPATGCTFGHEHGRDPRGSNLYARVGSVPFGVANEALDAWALDAPRHEDHVGHKIEWENDVSLRVVDVAGESRLVRCDVLVKIHQGTHSRDAFTNNLHELAYHVSCDGGFEVHATLLAAFGMPGEFVRSCDQTTVIAAGAPTPANSPAAGGARLVPDERCAERLLVAEGGTSDDVSATYEKWTGEQHLAEEGGRLLAAFDPNFAVFRPSRFYSPGEPNQLGRMVSLCYQALADGRRGRGGLCEAPLAAPAPLSFDDPRSPFDGVRREVYLRSTTLANAGGPTAWYTDPFGGHANLSPFRGSVRQFVAATSGTLGSSLPQYNIPPMGFNRDYGGPGVHAPN